MMDPTPPVYVFFPPGYQTTRTPPPLEGGDGHLSPLIIFFIALAALIALLIMICLIVMIYNVCRYGTCCPPSSNGGTGCCVCAPCCCYCTPCVAQPMADPACKSVIVQSPSSSYPVGSYVGRGTRLNQGSYVVAPRSSIRSVAPSRRNSIVIVGGQNTLPRRQVIQTVRPQIMISERPRIPTMGRSSGLMALPAPSSSSQLATRCYPRNEPMMSGNYGDDSDEVRVIVRNHPYSGASQRSVIIEAPPELSSSYSPPPAFENLTIRKSGGCGAGGGGGMSYGGGGGGGMSYGGGEGGGMLYSGGGGGGMGMDQGGGADVSYGYSGQHSATFDVCFDQAPEYTSDDGIQFQQTTIYPSLGETNFY